MKKTFVLIAVLILVAVVIVVLTGWNYNIVDTHWKFDYALVYLGDSEPQRIDIASWKDEDDGEQLTLVGTDGKVYLVSANYTMLVKENRVG